MYEIRKEILKFLESSENEKTQLPRSTGTQPRQPVLRGEFTALAVIIKKLERS